MTIEQQAEIPALLAKGAEAYGFRGDVWTASRVAEVIDRSFGVRYHRDHVGRLLREAGWSRQQPIERATQRDEEAIKAWSEQRWPALKKKPRRSKRPSTGRDEAGLYLLPMAVRTWAPRGQTPVLRVPLTRDHLSAGSSITLDGRLFMQVHPVSYDSAAVVGFLRVLLRKVSGKMVVSLLWFANPSRQADQSLSQTWSSQTTAPGATAWLCSRSQS